MSSVSNDSKVKIWDLRKGEALFSLHGHSGAANTVSFSHSGDYFATGGDDKLVLLWKSNFCVSDSTKSKAIPKKKRTVGDKIVTFPKKARLEQSYEEIKNNTSPMTGGLTSADLKCIGVDEINEEINTSNPRQEVVLQTDDNVARTMDTILEQLGKICSKINVTKILNPDNE